VPEATRLNRSRPPARADPLELPKESTGSSATAGRALCAILKPLSCVVQKGHARIKSRARVHIPPRGHDLEIAPRTARYARAHLAAPAARYARRRRCWLYCTRSRARRGSRFATRRGMHAAGRDRTRAAAARRTHPEPGRPTASASRAAVAHVSCATVARGAAVAVEGRVRPRVCVEGKQPRGKNPCAAVTTLPPTHTPATHQPVSRAPLPTAPSPSPSPSRRRIGTRTSSVHAAAAVTHAPGWPTWSPRRMCSPPAPPWRPPPTRP